MKLIILLLTVSILHVSASITAQTFTFSAKSISINNVLKEVEKQSGYNLFYKYNPNTMSKKIAVNYDNAKLQTVLDEVLLSNGLSYSLKNNSIIVNESGVVQSNTDVISNVQSNVLKGIVVSEDTKQILAGASVRVKGTSNGVATNSKGEFVLQNVKVGDVITVVFVGYKSQDIIVKNLFNLKIELSKDNNDLDEVVITGYQKIDKRTFTGSVGKVNPNDLATAGSGDVGKALQGMVAGVAVENTSGTFGTKSKIRIRGNSSISGNQEPLWVVDGIVLDDAVNVNPNQLYSGDASTMLSSAISGINPDDIEDIQILKDASATAMYGTQAVNGVIVVTTKRGKIGKSTIGYKNTFTVNQKPSILQFNVMNSKERMEFSEELYQKKLMDFTAMNRTYGAYGKLLDQMSRKEITYPQFYDEIQRAKTYNTDWFDVIFKNNLTQEHSLSLSAGSEKFQVYTSGGFFKDHGYVNNQYTNRYTGNIRANYNLSDKFSVMTSIYSSIRDQRTFGSFDSKEDLPGVSTREFDINPFTYARTTSRAMRPYNNNGELEYYQTNFAPFNILHELENNFMNVKLKEVKMQVDVNWKILKDLNFSSIFSTRSTGAYSEHIATELSNVAESYRADHSSIIWSNDRLYNDPYDNIEHPISIMKRGGILVTDLTNGDFYTFRNSLNFTPKIGNKHSFDVLFGTEMRHKKYYNDYYKGYGFAYYSGMTAIPDYRMIQRDLLSISGKPYYDKSQSVFNEFSLFANLAYTFNNKYNFTASVRSDGSNRLGKSEKFRFLPIWVLGASWNVDDEFGLQDVDWIDNLKLRSSYGLRGNISGIGSPEILAYYGNTTSFNPSTIESVINIVAPDNSNLQWEKEKMFNAAIEFGAFRRFNIIAEYYKRNNYDLIGQIQVSRVGGFPRKAINWASMYNEGFELTLNVQALKSDNFSWNTIFTFGYNKNRITELQTFNTVLQNTVSSGAAMVGRPVNGLYSFQFARLNHEGLPLFLNEAGEETFRIDKNSRDLDMLEYAGSREPLGSGGLTNSFKYKNLSFSFLFTYNYGNKIRLNPFYYSNYSDVEAIDRNLANRWLAPGYENYTNVPRIIDASTRSTMLVDNSDPFTYYNRSNIMVVDGSFVRLKNIMISYNLPQNWIKRAGLNNLQITGQGQNLLLWADKKLQGQDPEAIVSGISMPMPTSFTLGLTTNF